MKSFKCFEFYSKMIPFGKDLQTFAVLFLVGVGAGIVYYFKSNSGDDEIIMSDSIPYCDEEKSKGE